MRRAGSYDLDTGEVFDGTFVFVGKKIKSPYGREWMMMNQNFLQEFAARKDVGEQCLRVFLYLNARLDFENLIQVPQTEISEALEMDRGNVSNAVKKLLELGVVLQGPKIARSSTYRLNPMAGWKGKVRNLTPAISRHLKLVKDNPERDMRTMDMFDRTDPATT